MSYIFVVYQKNFLHPFGQFFAKNSFVVPLDRKSYI